MRCGLSAKGLMALIHEMSAEWGMKKQPFSVHAAGVQVTGSSRTRRPRRLGAWLSWLLVLFGAALLSLLILRDARLALLGEREVEGLVMEPADGQRFSQKRFEVTFQPKQGDRVTFPTASTCGSKFEPGQVVPVVYLASHPERAQIDTARQVWLPLAAGGLFSSGMLGAGLLMIAIRSGWRPVWR